MSFAHGVACSLCAVMVAAGGACGLEVGDRLPASVPVAWVGQAPEGGAHRLTLTVLFAAQDPIDRAIMPRMTDLAHRHPEVAVVGYCADGPTSIQRLRQELGAKLGFPVGAIASVDAFMPPVGLPCAVLSDGQGTVVWWGHPLDAPRPLVDALAGQLTTPIPPLDVQAPPSQPASAPASTSVPAGASTPATSWAPAPSPPATIWEEAPPPAPMSMMIEVDPWWCWMPAPLGWHARLPVPPLLPPVPPFGRRGWHDHERGDRGR